MHPSDEADSLRTLFQRGPDGQIDQIWRRWRQRQCPDFDETDVGGLAPDQVLTILRFDQLQRWRAGDRFPVERYLQTYTALKDDPEQALVLVYGEFLVRRELGESPTLDEYVRRFPQYATRLHEQDDFHRALQDMSDPEVAGSAQADATSPMRAGHCRLVGEIARGGMGVIFEGRDERLGRDLAVKLLREEHQSRPDVVRRFYEEARVCGDLQHPGVVPVHDVGTTADGRPYFTMKLVRGRTLAALLADRQSGGDELPRLLAIFAHVCQTVAFAHSRDVLHRDLKPANVMVGAFGEVQVMDWGLAKLVTRPTRGDVHGSAEGPASSVVDRQVQADTLTTQQVALTAAGTLVGTPAYMSPEQARGEPLDARCDVFGLGAILCEILTGQPPYAGSPKEEILTRVSRADLADARARLAGCGADAELVSLAQTCMAAARDDRPRDAGAVAEKMTAYLASVQERLRVAELERAAAAAKAEEARATAAAQRRAKRLTIGLAVSVLGLTVLGVGGWRLLERKAAEAVRGVKGSLEEIARLEREEKWPEALTLVQRTEAMLTPSMSADLRQQVSERRIDLDMVATLEDARLQVFDRREDAARVFGEAFRRYGIDVAVLEPANAAERIRRRAIRDQLVAGLDAWSFAEPDVRLTERLAASATAADPEPWRAGLRAAMVNKDGPALKKLTESPGLAGQPVRTLILLANALERTFRGSSDAAVLRVAQLAQRQFPGDVWANYQLAGTLDDQQPSQLDEALRYYTATVALRPRSAYARMNLGYALERKGKLEDAVAAYEESLRLKPDFALARLNLGNALQRQGKLVPAIESFRASIRQDATDPMAHYDLGNALLRNDQPDEAIASYREAVRLNPKFFQAYANMGNAFGSIGEEDEEIAAYRDAIRIAENDAVAWNNLGRALQKRGQLDDAVAALREAVRIRPEYAMAQCNLGLALQQQGLFADALDRLNRGHELGKKDPRWNRPSAAWISACERLIQFDLRLPAILGGVEPPDAERDDFAELFMIRKLPAAAARLYAGTFAEHPERAEDVRSGRRYNAVCAAALAAAGRGRDDPPLDESARAGWRKQAVYWLRAELNLWHELLARDPARTGLTARQVLRHWQQDADLAGLRDSSALANLPEEEQEACRRLWADVEALRGKAGRR
jgi:tetratricopeptide (TPR) repeat protein